MRAEFRAIVTGWMADDEASRRERFERLHAWVERHGLEDDEREIVRQMQAHKLSWAFGAPDWVVRSVTGDATLTLS